MFALSSVVAAVSLTLQQPAAPAPAPPTPAAAPTRAARSPRGLGAQLEAASAALQSARVDLASLTGLPGMSGLSGLTGLSGLSGLSGLEGLSSLSSLAGLETMAVDFGDGDDGELVGYPPPAWADLDPLDSLYRAARQLLSSGRYADAATAFADLLKRYPRSKYTADAYYWQAFALYKTGDSGNYRSARTALDYYRTHFSRADNRGDADALYAQIQAALAKQGDPDAAKWIREQAQNPGNPRDTTTRTCSTSDDDDDPRIAALNALLQMDAESAMPILKQVLARRDACSVALRRKAVFIISQKRTAETEDILLSAARGDPDQEVREQAVFWLSQVGSEKAVTALDSILQSSTDEEIQKKALFALSQIRGDRAGQILRDFAEKSSASDDAREQAIFWLGQGHSAQNATFLRGLYARLNSDDLKEKVIFSLSQMRDPDNGRWLLDLAQNEREPVEMRKKALFWAGQTGASLPDLAGIYDRTTNEEMKEQLIFVYSQRHESEAVDKLIDIAKHDPNAELRKKAVFWLGQSHDPRARQALLDIINQ